MPGGPLDPSTTGNWWEYSRWVKNVARNSRITPPTASEEGMIRVFLKSICDPIAFTGTRPWLNVPFKERATAAAGGANYQCDIDKEPVPVLIRLLEVVGRDFKKIPLNNYEQAMADDLFIYTDNRRLGTAPYFGNVGGAEYTLPS